MHHQVIETIYGRTLPNLLAWFYPPYALLLALPLALIPYYCSLGLWFLSGLAVYGLAVYKNSRHRLIFGISLSLPAVLLNLWWGQTAFFTSSLLLGFISCLDHHPILAGFMLGLLAYKPQFAVLCFIAVLAGRYWRCLAAALITLSLLITASLLLWGLPVWQAYLVTISNFNALSLLDGWVNTSAIQPTTISLLRLLDVKLELALSLQSIITALLVLVTYTVWRSRPQGEPISCSILGLCTLLAQPYFLQYDMVLVIIPIIYYLAEHTALTRMEVLLVSLLWADSFLAWPIVLLTHIQITPLICTALLLCALRRFYRQNKFAVFPSC